MGKVILLVMVLAASCDSSSSDSGGSTAPPPPPATNTAPQKCGVIAQHLCTKLVNCGLDTFARCTTQAYTSFGCANAVAIGATFDTCIAEIDALPCNQVSALPVSCAGVVQVR